MKLNRDKIKAAVDSAVLRAFAERKTVNVMLAVGLNTMVDEICNELEALDAPQKKKVA